MDPELITISEELEALGGGDARIGRLTMRCEVGPDADGPGAGASIVSMADDGRIRVLDPRCPGDVPASQAQRVYSIPMLNSVGPAGRDMWAATVQEAADWVTAGFNCTVIGFGQAGTGKSRLLLGGTHSSSLSDGGFLTAFLRAVFSRKGAGRHVGLSCWEMIGADDPVDLLGQAPTAEQRAGSTPQTPSGFVCTEVQDIGDAEQVLRFARMRSCNWAGQAGAPAERLRMLPNRAHAFVRVALFDEASGLLSALSLVDLIGSRPLEAGGAPSGAKGADPLSQTERERRLLNRQMLAFSRFMSELAQHNGVLLGSQRMAAARDTKLTALLSSLMINNSRTFLLATVSPNAEDYMDTVNTLRIASRGQHVQVACMRSADAAGSYSAWLPKERVVSIGALQVTRAQAHSHRDGIAQSGGPLEAHQRSSARSGRHPDSVLQHYTAQYCTSPPPEDTGAGGAGSASSLQRHAEPAVRGSSAADSVRMSASPSRSQARTPPQRTAPPNGAPYGSAAAASASTFAPGSMMSIDPTPDGSFGSYATQYAKRRMGPLMSPPGSPMSYDQASSRQHAAHPATGRSQLEAESASLRGGSTSLRPSSAAPDTGGSVPQTERFDSPGESDYARRQTPPGPPPGTDRGEAIKARFHQLCSTMAEQPGPEAPDTEPVSTSPGQASSYSHRPMSISPQRRNGRDALPYELPSPPASPPAHYPQYSDPGAATSPVALESPPEDWHPVGDIAAAYPSAGSDFRRAEHSLGGHPPASRSEGGEDDADTATPRSPPRSPGPPHHAERAAADGEGRQGDEGRGGNAWLIDLLEQERRTVEKLQDKLQQAESLMTEVSTEYEVKLDGFRQENVTMRSRCRRLQAETEFQSLFDDYEREISSVQAEMSALRGENSELLKLVSRLQASGSAGLSPPGDASPSAGGPNKIQELQQKLRRSEGERTRLAKELGEMKKNSRAARVHRSQAEDTMRRVQELQRKLDYKEQQVQQRGLAAADAVGRAEMMEVEMARLRDVNSRVTEENRQLKRSVGSLEEIVSKLRQPRRQALQEANLPAYETASPGANGRRTRAGQARAVELLRQLERHLPGKSPKVEQIVGRLLDEIMAYAKDRDKAAEREEALMKVITGESGGARR